MPNNDENNKKKKKRKKREIQQKNNKQQKPTLPTFKIEQPSSTSSQSQYIKKLKKPKPPKRHGRLYKPAKDERFSWAPNNRYKQPKTNFQTKKTQNRQPYKYINPLLQAKAYQKNPQTLKVVQQYQLYQRQLKKVVPIIKHSKSISGYTQSYDHLQDLIQSPNKFINKSMRTYNITKLRQQNKEIANFLKDYLVSSKSRLKRAGEIFFEALRKGYEERMDSVKNILLLGSDQFDEQELRQVTQEDSIHISINEIPEQYRKEVFNRYRDKRLIFINKNEDLKTYNTTQHERNNNAKQTTF